MSILGMGGIARLSRCLRESLVPHYFGTALWASCASGARWSNPCGSVHTSAPANKKGHPQDVLFYLAERVGLSKYSLAAIDFIVFFRSPKSAYVATLSDILMPFPGNVNAAQ